MIREPESFGILIDTIERFVRERLIPREQEVTETDSIPGDILAEMRRIGLFGLTIPEAYGGLGATMEEEILAVMALCRASVVFRSCVGTNTGIGSQGIVFDGTEAQKKKYRAPACQSANPTARWASAARRPPMSFSRTCACRRKT